MYGCVPPLAMRTCRQMTQPAVARSDNGGPQQALCKVCTSRSTKRSSCRLHKSVMHHASARCRGDLDAQRALGSSLGTQTP